MEARDVARGLPPRKLGIQEGFERKVRSRSRGVARQLRHRRLVGQNAVQLHNIVELEAVGVVVDFDQAAGLLGVRQRVRRVFRRRRARLARGPARPGAGAGARASGSVDGGRDHLDARALRPRCPRPHRSQESRRRAQRVVSRPAWIVQRRPMCAPRACRATPASVSMALPSAAPLRSRPPSRGSSLASCSIVRLDVGAAYDRSTAPDAPRERQL